MAPLKNFRVALKPFEACCTPKKVKTRKLLILKKKKKMDSGIQKFSKFRIYEGWSLIIVLCLIFFVVSAFWQHLVHVYQMKAGSFPD